MGKKDFIAYGVLFTGNKGENEDDFCKKAEGTSGSCSVNGQDRGAKSKE